MRRLPFAVLATVLVLLLAGCGGKDEGKPLGPVSDETPSASPTKGTSGAAEDAKAFDDRGHDVLRGTVQAPTPEAQAVAEAWFAYWEVRVRSFGEARADPALGTVAGGSAQTDVVGYVAYLKNKNLHTVGDSKFSVRDVKVRGAEATLNSCVANRSVDVDAQGTPAEQLTPFYTVAGTLEQAGGAWRVVGVRIVNTNGCRA